MTDKSQDQLIDRMAEEAKRGRLSRRDFMHYATAAGVTATTATGLWTSKVRAATPQKGGTFRIGQHDGNTSDSLDPGTYLSQSHIQHAATHRSYLTMINPDQSLGSDLAESWEGSADASSWTFKLTRDASFHSGKPVTAKDVVASMNHHRGEDSTSAATALFKDVDDVIAEDDYTVTFKLAGPNADLPWLLTDYHLTVLPANEDGSMDWQSGDGSGPYKLEEYDPGVRSHLVRHDGWHLEGAYFDEVEFIILNDPNARQSALVTGDIDVATLIETKTMALLQRSPDIEIENVPSAAAITLPMFCDTAPFDDVNVRNALKLSINRQEIIEKIAFGAATIGNDFHVSPAMPYWPESIAQREYDPDQAKSLLKKAGAEGLEVSLSTADSIYSGAVDLCVLYAEHAKAAGIKINVVREPNDGYWADVWLKKPFVMVSWGARPTPDVMFSLAYKDDAAWNESHWQNERFNKLLLEAKAELDQAKRAEMYHEMCLLARDDGGTVLPMFNNWVYARRSNVAHGEKLAANWPLDGARGSHRWWFADA